MNPFRKAQRLVSRRSSVVVGVAAACVLVHPLLWWQPTAMAAWGPCTEDTAYSFLNTIGCVNGACTGMVQIVPRQTTCKNQNENPCTDGPNDLYITYQWASQSLGWTTFLGCISGTAACIACVALCAAGCLDPPTWWACATAAGLCATICATSSVSWCCYNTCFQDLSTRFAVPGGHFCS